MGQSDMYAEQEAAKAASAPPKARSNWIATNSDLDIRFKAHSVSPFEEEQITRMRWEARRFAGIIAATVPVGREQSLALTKIEEALFWADAGIARS